MKNIYYSVLLILLLLLPWTLEAEGPYRDNTLSETEISDKLFCETDEDCACGVDETGRCAFGNKKHIDTSIQCPDFCTGIHGKLRLRCIEKRCEMRLE